MAPIVYFKMLPILHVHCWNGSICTLFAVIVKLTGAARECSGLVEEVPDFPSVEEVNTRSLHVSLSKTNSSGYMGKDFTPHWCAKQTNMVFFQNTVLTCCVVEHNPQCAVAVFGVALLKADPRGAAAWPYLRWSLLPLRPLPEARQPVLLLPALCSSGAPRGH